MRLFIFGSRHGLFRHNLDRTLGLRLLTSDEWEYVCGAGSRTLFRWGDFCPGDCYPGDCYPTDDRSDWNKIVSGRKTAIEFVCSEDFSPLKSGDSHSPLRTVFTIFPF
jgi:hypothetical protein